MKRLVVLTAVTLLLSPRVPAQPTERDRGERPGAVLYEGISRAGGDSSHCLVDVPYRIDQEFFVPVKNNDSSIDSPFVRRGEVAVDLVDSVGVSRAREITEVVIGQNSIEPSQEQKRWYQGVMSFRVPPGTYTIQIEVTDLESQRDFLEKHEKIRAQRSTDTRVRMFTPVFVQGEPGPLFPDTLTLQNLSGNILFGEPGSLFFELDPGTVADTSLRVSWAIKQTGGDGKESDEVARDSSAGFVTLRHLVVDTADGQNGVRYIIRTDSLSRIIGVVMPIPAERLLLRLFTLDLTVSLGSHEEHRTVTFRTVWPSMPFSLRDVDLALDALRFIVSPAHLDSLKEGTFAERREHLETFWKLRDRTPGTARNELMTEYYRRVDYAMRNFGTLRVPDGSRTDRGKIYILYGPPTAMDRILDPVAGFQETWRYERIGKKFVFKDQSKSGNYVLSSSDGS
jgi:GWxTD domain-containing protein